MRARLRTAISTVTLAPWRRAPFLAVRRPGVLASVAGASALLAASLAAVPVFLSSVGTEAVAVQAGDRCSRDTGATYGFVPTAANVAAPAPDPFAPLGADLGPTVRSVRAETSLGDPATGIDEPVVVLARDGALDHVEVVDGTPGPGVWVSDRAASMTGLGGVGARATIGGVEVPVAGVYRDMAGTTFDDFWCVHAGDLALEGPEREPPPPVVLTDPATFATLMRDSGVGEATGAWDAPLRAGVTVDRAERLIDALACGTDDAEALSWCAGGPPQIPTAFGRVAGDGSVEARDDAELVSVLFGSHLPFVVDRTRAIQTSVGAGVWPIAAFAALGGRRAGGRGRVAVVRPEASGDHAAHGAGRVAGRASASRRCSSWPSRSSPAPPPASPSATRPSPGWGRRRRSSARPSSMRCGLAPAPSWSPRPSSVGWSRRGCGPSTGCGGAGGGWRPCRGSCCWGSWRCCRSCGSTGGGRRRARARRSAGSTRSACCSRCCS